MREMPIETVTGKPVVVHIVMPGDERYDARHREEPLIHFSSYMLHPYFYSTLAGTDGNHHRLRPAGQGLILHGGDRSLDIDGETMDRVMAWVRSEIGPPPVTLRVVDDLPF